MLLGVDVGGTFTDAVLLTDGGLHTAKAPTTPDDQSEGVAAAIDRVFEAAGLEQSAMADVDHFAHGMTVGTNALLERSGARTALIATEGFTDLLEIARQDRVELYHPRADRPPPLSPADARVGVAERNGPDGEVDPLTEDEIERVVEAVAELDAEAAAICLLFSYRYPDNEKRLAEALREAHPDLHVSVSSEVLPKFREYERCSTTVIDAYLAPLLRRYLRRLAETCGERDLREPSVMLSSGGVAPIEEAARGAAWSVISGPAGGAVGAGLIARLSDAPDALGFDMGGTSCDVSVISDGEVRRTGSRELAGRPIQLPMVDVHTVGAGGGSIGWRDPGGALRVGPRSAGAEPGPAAYGKGGTEPTVTDANVALGYLPRGGGLAGGIELDGGAAEEAVSRLADELGLEPLEAAEGIYEIANQEMVRALRVVTVEQGIDPRDHALIAFGGAGGLHAAAVADELGIGRVLSPAAGGVLSALGLAATERRRDRARTVMLTGEELTAPAISERVDELAAEASDGLSSDHELEVVYEMRYRGQAFELGVEGGPDPDPAALRESFADRHEDRYGYRDDDGEVELVGIRVAAIEPGEDPELSAGGEGGSTSTRRMRFDGEWVEGEVVEGGPGADANHRGPCVFELPETTLVVPPGWTATRDQHGTIELRRDEAGGAGGR